MCLPSIHAGFWLFSASLPNRIPLRFTGLCLCLSGYPLDPGPSGLLSFNGLMVIFFYDYFYPLKFYFASVGYLTFCGWTNSVIEFTGTHDMLHTSYGNYRGCPR